MGLQKVMTVRCDICGPPLVCIICRLNICLEHAIKHEREKRSILFVRITLTSFLHVSVLERRLLVRF